MKKYLFILAVIACSVPINYTYAQTIAIDENGRQVLLYSNGTWKYDLDSLNKNTINDTIKNNSTIFTKPADNNFLIKSNTVNVGIYFNTSKWAVKPHLDNEAMPEYRFSLKSSDAYAMVITEKTQIDIAEMRDIALINAQKAAPDAKITSSEYRNVNGLRILCLKITGTIKGIKFEYFGYYYSNENGTVQFITYSSQNLFNNTYSAMQDLLNGLIEVKKP